MSVSKKQNAGTVYVLYAVISVLILLGIFLLNHQYSKRKKLIKQLDDIENWSGKYTSLKNEYDDYIDKRNKLINFIDIEPREAEGRYHFLNDAQVLMEINDCSITTLNPISQYTKNIFDIVEYHVELTGDYKNIFMFLYNIESLLNGYRIKDITIKKKKNNKNEKNETGNFSVEMVVMDYDLKTKRKELFTENEIRKEQGINPIYIVDLAENFVNSSIQFGISQNYFKNDFCEIGFLSSPEKMTSEYLATGFTSFTIMNSYEILLNSFYQNDFTVLGLFSSIEEGKAVLVRENSAIKKVTDLNNKKIGVHNEIGYVYAKELIEKNNLDGEGIKIIKLEKSFLRKSLDLGYLDAVIFSKTAAEITKNYLGEKVEILVSEDEKHYDFLVAGTETLKENKEKILSLIQKRILNLASNLKIPSNNSDFSDFLSSKLSINIQQFNYLISHVKYFTSEENKKMAQNGEIKEILRKTYDKLNKYERIDKNVTETQLDLVEKNILKILYEK